MKEKIGKEYYRRVRGLMQLELNAKIICGLQKIECCMLFYSTKEEETSLNGKRKQEIQVLA